MVIRTQLENKPSTAEQLEALHALNGDNTTPADPLDLSTLTDDDLRHECKKSLAQMIRNHPGDLKALGAIREMLDRLEGKPIARTEMDVRSLHADVTPKPLQLSDLEIIRRYEQQQKVIP